MATPGDFLVTRTVNDATTLLAALEQIKAQANRIAQRMVAIGAGALNDYQWPNGYMKADFVALYNALNSLPGLVVADSVRDALYKLVSSIQ